MDNLEVTLKYLHQALKLLANKMDDFYLVGGTALALHYQHRESYDLDFFTKNFQLKKIDGVVDSIGRETRKPVRLVAQSTGREDVKQRRYEMIINKEAVLKIDFVEDPTELIRPLDKKNGIYLASIEDIYLRKIFAVSGIPIGVDKLGRIKSKGGRQTARDLFDIYHLSITEKHLSGFVLDNFDRINIEGLITWFHGLDKKNIKIELSEIITNNNLEYHEIERHLFPEINKILGEISGYE